MLNESCLGKSDFFKIPSLTIVLNESGFEKVEFFKILLILNCCTNLALRRLVAMISSYCLTCLTKFAFSIKSLVCVSLL